MHVMSSFQVRCPQCSLLLGAVGSGQVNIRCAACGTVFGVQIAQPLGAFAPPPPPPPPQPFASFQAVPTPTAVQNLCALGFPEAQARAALRSSDGDVERAATLLLATPRETAASPSHAASPNQAVRARAPPPEPAADAEDRELQQALEASRRESQQSSIPVAVAVPATAGSTAPVAVAATAVAATAVAAGAATAAAAGARAPPLLNTAVELQSLVRRPELNGQQGIAETFEHGRYQVRLLRGGETIAVRPEHLVAAEEAELQRALAASSVNGHNLPAEEAELQRALWLSGDRRGPPPPPPLPPPPPPPPVWTPPAPATAATPAARQTSRAQQSESILGAQARATGGALEGHAIGPRPAPPLPLPLTLVLTLTLPLPLPLPLTLTLYTSGCRRHTSERRPLRSSACSLSVARAAPSLSTRSYP